MTVRFKMEKTPNGGSVLKRVRTLQISNDEQRALLALLTTMNAESMGDAAFSYLKRSGERDFAKVLNDLQAKVEDAK